GSIRSRAMRHVTYRESGFVLLDDKIFDSRTVGSPVAVSHQVGDGAKHLGAVIGDAAQIALYKVCAQPPRRKVCGFDFDFLGAENQEVIRLLGHRSIAPILTDLPLAALS